MVSLRNRVVSPGIVPDRGSIQRLHRLAERLAYLAGTTVADPYGELPKRYVGSKRAKYEQATEQVLLNGYSKSDANTTHFVKFDKIDPEKVNPDPRAIQFRRPKYCVAIGRFTKPIEELLYPMKGDGKIWPSTRLIAKGLSQRARGRLLWEKWCKFEHPVAILLDASRFDKHVSYQMLQVEAHVYMKMIPDSELQKLLSWQLVTHGTSSAGIRYKAYGRRMSGDMNTALGNCVIALIMFGDAMQGIKYEIADDGDDALVIVEYTDRSRVVEHIVSKFYSYGFKLRIDQITEVFEEITFCQSHPVWTPRGYRMVRDYRKMFSSSLSGIKFKSPPHVRARLLTAIGSCELALNQGIPMLQAYSLMLLRNGSDAKKIIELERSEGLYYRAAREFKYIGRPMYAKLEPKRISDETRLSFHLAFGVTPTAQRAVEARFESMDLNLVGDVPLLPLDEDWVQDRPCTEVYPLGDVVCD